MHRVVGRGARVRATASLTSAILKDLDPGTFVLVVESDGTRLRICDPVEGWVSRRVVVPTDDSTELKYRSPDYCKVVPSLRCDHDALKKWCLDEDAGLERRDGRLWFGNLAECGDLSCGCCRSQGTARKRFLRLVRDSLRAERVEEIRYVSLGSGLLLSDAEVLATARHDGARIRSVAVIDPLYRHPTKEVAAALRDFTDFLGVPVHAFGSSRSFVRARNALPFVFGQCSVFCHIDAAVARRHVSEVRVLVPGGLAFELCNEARGFASMRASVYRGGSLVRLDARHVERQALLLRDIPPTLHKLQVYHACVYVRTAPCRVLGAIVATLRKDDIVIATSRREVRGEEEWVALAPNPRLKGEWVLARGRPHPRSDVLTLVGGLRIG